MPPVSVQNDICLNLLPIPLFAPHNFIPLPPFPPVPPPMPAAVAACHAFELPVTAWWPPGFALGGASFTTTVFHKFMQICLDGHDCGKFIPHVQASPAPNNTLTLTHIPLSKRSANFASSTVKLNGKGVAAMTLISWPPCPMTYCAEPLGLPLADAPTSHLNTVTFGISLTDWIFGVIAIAADMILDWVFMKLDGGQSKKLGADAAEMIAKSKLGKHVYQLIAKDLIGKGFKRSGQEYKRMAIKQAVGFATGVARAIVTGEGSASVSYEIGGPFLGLKASVGFKRTQEKGTELTYGAKGTAATASVEANEGGASVVNNHPLGLGAESHATEWGKPGVNSEETTTDPGLEFRNTSTKTSPDGAVARADSRGPSTTPLANAL